MDARLRPAGLAALSGEEKFSAGDAAVLDFWRWALGDLRMNNARGYLAEFLVGRAVGSQDPRRVEWAAHDVTARDGTRIEVKSSAYLQSWSQTRVSTPRFSLTGAAESWNETTGEYAADPRGRVDVWVFGLQTCREHRAYDPLLLEQWSFWVLPDAVVQSLGQKTCGLARLHAAAGPPCGWEDLGGAVSRAAEATRLTADR